MSAASCRVCRACLVIVLVLLSGAAASAAPLTVTPNVGLAETLTDNVLFDDTDRFDALTRLRVGLGLAYQTQSSTTTLHARLSALYQARSSTATVNLGEAQRLGLSTNYSYSERLRFSISDQFGRVGSSTRDLPFVDAPFGGTQQTPAEEDPAGNNPSDVNLILPNGSALNNSLSIGASYQAAPLWTTSATYFNGVSNFADINSTDVSQSLGLTVGRQYNPVLTINGRFSYSYLYSSDFDDSDTYSLSAGPSYNPGSLWSFSALLGGSLNRNVSSGKVRGGVNASLSVTRILEDSVVIAGLNNGFTPSAGVAGASQTTSVYTTYSRRLTQWLSGNSSLRYSHFNTTDTDFDILSVQVGLFYPILQDVSLGLNYAYRWRDGNQGTSNTTLTAGVVDANIVSLQVSWSRPLWLLDL